MPRQVLIHDSISQKLTVVCNVVPEAGKDAEKLHADGCARIEAVLAQLRQPLPESICAATACGKHEFRSNMEARALRWAVERAEQGLPL